MTTKKRPEHTIAAAVIKHPKTATENLKAPTESEKALSELENVPT